MHFFKSNKIFKQNSTTANIFTKIEYEKDGSPTAHLKLFK